LLMERKNIQSPAGWLRAALKNDYRGKEPAEQERCLRSHPHLNPPPSKGEETRRMDSRLLGNDIEKSESEDKKILSREKALGWIREIRRGLGANG